MSQLKNLTNLFSFASKQANYQQALNYAKEMSLLNPDIAHYMYACTYLDLGKFDKGIEHNQKIKKRDYNADIIMSMLLLKNQNIEGWQYYKKRKHSNTLKDLPYINHPGYWNKQRCPEGTILIIGEQGLGDTIMVSRYFKVLREEYGFKNVLFKHGEQLKCIMDYVDDCEFIGQGQYDFNYVINSLDLIPLLDNISGGKHPPAEFNLPPIRKKLTKTSPLHVGLAWCGNSKYARDKHRSLEFDQVRHLFLTKGVTFHSLQLGETMDNVPNNCQTLVPHINDILDTAQFIRQLDIVITVDTMIAHLSASLGKETWIMLPSVACWRWGQNGTTSDYYPSATLYRQSEAKNWFPVLEQIRLDLTKRVNLKID